MSQVWNKDYDAIKVYKYENRAEMGHAAAKALANIIQKVMKEKEFVNVVFASAPSQMELLAYLAKEEIDWERINAFHMDEYIGLDAAAPQGFGNFLKNTLFRQVTPANAYYIDGQNPDPAKACLAYTALLKQHTPDIICLGIGENGHLAFNDPPVADFKDPEMVKVVKLDDICRMQQVNDGCFTTLAQVPTHAITLTMSCILAVSHAIAVVPGPTKAKALAQTVTGEISPQCPASSLRNKTGTLLFTDGEGGALLAED